jgi:outer membrane protein TolC
MALARRSGAALALVLAAAAISGAEDPAGRGTWWGFPYLRNQWRRDIPESEALRVPHPVTRDANVQEVTLKEAIALALENNPGIAARRLEPPRVETGVLQAQSQFDPQLLAEVESHQSTTPNVNSLSETQVTNVDERFANFHVLKTFRTGTQVSVDSLNERLDNSSTFFTLRPQYQPALNFSLIQPLLRGFGWDFSYLVVRVAEQTADAAVYQYEADLANFVTEVIAAYWNVVRAREQLRVQRESKALADRTVVENEARVRVGLLPPVSVLEAQADAKSREEQVLIAENQVAVSHQRLAQLVFFRPDGTFVPRTLEPIEMPEAEELRVDVDRGLETALAERPEVHASAHTIRARQLNERIAENGLLPRVDLVGSYGVNALSGRQGTTPDSFFSRTDLGGCTPVIVAGQTLGFSCPGQLALSPFRGDRADAYDRLVSNDYRSYSFGVQVQVPFSNALARSQYAERRIARDQAELDHRELLSRVTLEVRQAAADVVSTRQRIDTSRIARELAAENLRQQEKRHEVGMATTKDLLDFQTQLTTARQDEVQANIEYALSVARWRRAQGELLAHYQIVIEQPGRRTPPWFARF